MFLPPTIDLGNSEKYILSIRIDPTSFMFSLTDPKVGKHYCLRGTNFDETERSSLLQNIQKIIFELNFLTQQYAKTNVIFVSTKYKLVPSDLYDVKSKNELYSFTSLDKDVHVLTNELPRYETTTLYQVEEEVYEFLSRSLYNPYFYHHTTSLINLFEGRSKTISLHSKMYINQNDDLLDVICFSGDKLIHSQTYQGLSAQEQVYFILKLWEALELDQLKDELLVAGELSEAVLDAFREYIKNVNKLAAPSEIYLWHQDAQKTPLDLIALSL